MRPFNFRDALKAKPKARPPATKPAPAATAAPAPAAACAAQAPAPLAASAALSHPAVVAALRDEHAEGYRDGEAAGRKAERRRVAKLLAAAGLADHPVAALAASDLTAAQAIERLPQNAARAEAARIVNAGRKG